MSSSAAIDGIRAGSFSPPGTMWKSRCEDAVRRRGPATSLGGGQSTVAGALFPRKCSRYSRPRAVAGQIGRGYPTTRRSSRRSGSASRSTTRDSIGGPAASDNRATIRTERTQSPHQMPVRQSNVHDAASRIESRPGAIGSPERIPESDGKHLVHEIEHRLETPGGSPRGGGSRNNGGGSPGPPPRWSTASRRPARASPAPAGPRPGRGGSFRSGTSGCWNPRKLFGSHSEPRPASISASI